MHRFPVDLKESDESNARSGKQLGRDPATISLTRNAGRHAFGINQTRRQFLTGLGAAMLVGYGASGSTTQPSRRPNILVLVTDDQRADMFGEGGGTLIGTPNIDRLAREGVLFENNFVTTSICPASRASLFTGLYARCHGVFAWNPSFDGAMLDYGYPGRLRASGYYTGFTGKFGIAHKDPLNIASRFDWFRGFSGQGEYLLPDGGHLTERLGMQALEFLDTTDSNRPWNLSVSFKAPHAQDKVAPYFISDPSYDDLYRGVKLPTLRHMDGRYYDSLPEFLRKETESRLRWERRFGSPELWERSVKGYFALIHGVDVQVGRILEKIEGMGQAENTVVIFTSDNGFFLGERGWAGKWYPHEESIRTPMIVRDPRYRSASGTRRTEMTLNIDVCPTILGLADAPAPLSMNGRDLSPLVRGDKPDWRQEWFYEHLLENPRIPKSEGIRRTEWKYFVFPEGEPAYEELYDLRADPHEESNLAESRDHSEMLSVMRWRRTVWAHHLEGWSAESTWQDPT